jgi:light-regulated signal transduction histidine kinase (bacteriophytochrome)
MSGGLWDAGAGISVGGSHIANWLIGQVRDETQTEEKMRDYAREIGADEDALIEAFREVPAMSREQFAKVAGVLFTLANQLSNTAYQNVQQARFISERKEMEKELQLLNAELEKRVTIRTAELERLNKELESFCYSISHEIRAPIARLTGFSRAISESVAEEDVEALKHLADRTEVASEHLRSVIDALLTKNRLSRAELSMENVNLSALCREIIDELLVTEGKRKIRVIIAPDVTAYGDRQMLQICMKHLLANALKYSSRKSEAIIEFGRSVESGSEIYFIRDNGAGFDMEFADKLFKPFGRLHNEYEFEGNGFGLALVHEVIERHKGRIWAESCPGNGATFSFTLGGQ